MSITQISYRVREFVKSQLLDNSIGFNFQIQQSAPLYDVTPFTLAVGSSPPSLWLGRYDPGTLYRSAGAIAPFAVLSVVKDDSRGKQAMRITPSIYSAPVLISVDFFIDYPEGGAPPDGEGMFHAVEDAFINTFNQYADYSVIPSGITYNNEVLVVQGKMEWQDNRWVQTISCGLDFYLIT